MANQTAIERCMTSTLSISHPTVFLSGISPPLSYVSLSTIFTLFHLNYIFVFFDRLKNTVNLNYIFLLSLSDRTISESEMRVNITILLHEMLSNNAKPIQDSCSNKNYTQEDTERRTKQN